MPLWTYIKEPSFQQVKLHGAVRREDGWHDAKTNELLVCISNLFEKHDNVVDNLELEDGFNLLLENNVSTNEYILLE